MFPDADPVKPGGPTLTMKKLLPFLFLLFLPLISEAGIKSTLWKIVKYPVGGIVRATLFLTQTPVDGRVDGETQSGKTKVRSRKPVTKNSSAVSYQGPTSEDYFRVLEKK